MNGEDLFVWSIFLFVGFLMGLAAGESTVENKWRDRTVDNPDYIATIRSSVLAEREIIKLEDKANSIK